MRFCYFSFLQIFLLVFAVNYGRKPVQPFGYGSFYRVHRGGARRRSNTVSLAEQDRRFRELTAEFSQVPHGSHKSIKQRLAMHKLYGETH